MRFSKNRLNATTTSLCPFLLIRWCSQLIPDLDGEPTKTKHPKRFNLFNCPQCSRASVTLAEKLPSISGSRVPTAPKRRDASVSLSSPPPSAGGDKSSGTISSEGAAEDFFPGADSDRIVDGVAERVAEGVAEGVAEDSSQDEGQGQDDSGAAIVWNRIKLALGDVCAEKVVEKGALGTTAKGAMAVSCREVRQRGCGSVGVSRVGNTGASLTQRFLYVTRNRAPKVVRCSLPDTC